MKKGYPPDSAAAVRRPTPRAPPTPHTLPADGGWRRRILTAQGFFPVCVEGTERQRSDTFPCVLIIGRPGSARMQCCDPGVSYSFVLDSVRHPSSINSTSISVRNRRPAEEGFLFRLTVERTDCPCPASPDRMSVRPENTPGRRSTPRNSHWPGSEGVYRGPC